MADRAGDVPASAEPDVAHLDPEVFSQLISELDGQRTTMSLAAWIRQPGSGGFGGSALGGLLSHHTELARGHVVTGVHEVSDLLDAYVNGLRYYRSGMEETDTESSRTFTRIQASAAQVATALDQTTPDNAAPVAPALPGTADTSGAAQ